MKLAGVSSLYICYFGLNQPLVQTQVLPYLRELARAGCTMHLLTFEPQAPSTQEEADWREQLQADGIHWHWLRYHRRLSLLAKLYDIRRGNAFVRELARTESLDILHARSHVAAAIARGARGQSAAKIIFDIRGLMPEEYVDAGHWSRNGISYRLTKAREKKLLEAADSYVVLTRNAETIVRQQVAASKPISVIPCCVDTERFNASHLRQGERGALGLRDDEKLLVYVGALDGWYLTREMADFFAEARAIDSRWRLFVATQSEARTFAARLAEQNVPTSAYKIQFLPASQIPNLLAAADAAYCFIKPSYSKRASSPTKIAEYLAAGLPVLCNTGIGDVDDLLLKNSVGVILKAFGKSDYQAALHQLSTLSVAPDIAKRCRAVAQDQLDLRTVGGPAYQELYLRTLAREARAQHA